MQVTVSVAIMQLQVSAAHMQVTVSVANMWMTIFIVIMEMGVSATIMPVILKALSGLYFTTFVNILPRIRFFEGRNDIQIGYKSYSVLLFSGKTYERWKHLGFLERGGILKKGGEVDLEKGGYDPLTNYVFFATLWHCVKNPCFDIFHAVWPLKELQNRILCVTRVWSLFCSIRSYRSLQFLPIPFNKQGFRFSVFCVFCVFCL